MRRLDLREYEVTPPVELTSAEVQALQAHPAVEIAPALHEQTTHWLVRSRQYVGVIGLDGLEVRIHPKVAVNRLLFLLGYSTDADGWLDTITALESAEDLLGTIGHALSHHAERALAVGVLQGYVTREEAMPGLRGRLREGDQIRSRMGLALPLEVTYDDFSPDIPENQLLRTSAEVLLRLPIDQSTRRRIAHLRRALNDVSTLAVGTALPDITFTRLNRRYRAATILARLVLQRRSIEFAEPELAGTAFLFDMNRVFEDFVSTALGRALQERCGRTVAQHRSHLDEARRIPIKPDVTWWQGRQCIAVVDAKYKAVASEQIPNPDVYQVFAYCTALGLPVGHLVYPTGEGEPTVHVIRNAGIEVQVHTIPLAEPQDRLLDAVERVADRIAAANMASRPFAIGA